MSDRTGVLFVCMGNICRSPLAEGIFVHMADQLGMLDRFEVDSCGTGDWHVGHAADARSIEVGARHGIRLTSIGRQVDPKRDFERFDLLVAMDRLNAGDLVALGAPPRRVRLMRSFDPAVRDRKGPDLDVPDPYNGPGDGFARVYDMLWTACGGLLEHLLDQRRG